MSDNYHDKFCLVCGDVAKVRNFGALSCESCKCFFRRNVINDQEMECFLHNKCVINVKTRKLCKKCRLDKCYAIGMIKQLVLSKHKNLVHKSGHTKNISDNWSIDSNTEISENDCSPQHDNLSLTNEEINEELDKIENLFVKGQDEKETPTVSIVKPIATFDKQLNEIEINKIMELSKAANHMTQHELPSTNNVIEIEHFADFSDKFYPQDSFDESVRSTVKFIKGVNKFKEIPEPDQLILIKHCCWKMFVLKKIPTYNFHDESWTIPISPGIFLRYKLSLFKEISEDAYQFCRRLWDNISLNWRNDRFLIPLLMAICLFSCDSDKLKHANYIRLNQQMYLHLLQRYLIQNYRIQDRTADDMNAIMSLFPRSINFLTKNMIKYIGTSSPLVVETLED